MSDFSRRADTFLAEFFGLYPVVATAVGMHDHDGAWPDMSEAGRQERIAFVERWQADLAGIDAAGLTADEVIDRDLLLAELEALRFELVELREDQWDPLGYTYLLGEGLFTLLARDFAPLASRLGSVVSRLEGLPDVLVAARGQLGGRDGRPVSRLHLETALRQLDGVTQLSDQALSEASAAGGTDERVAALQPSLADAAATAADALAGFRRFLEDELSERAEGDGRLGPALYAAKLRHTFKTSLTGEQIVGQARREFEAVRAEMIRIARSIWSTWLPDQEPPSAATEGSPEAADQRLVRAVLEAISRAHQQPQDVLDFLTREHWRIVEFCTRQGLVDVPDEPLEIIWTPLFLRQFAGAMLMPPGALDKGQKTFLCFTPPPDDWTADQVESYMAEDNDRMLTLLAIHEGTPGHYLQGAYANRCQSLVRAVFQSGVFAEGWAVYVTQVMIDAGFAADDPALLLTHWKFYLRAVINALIDVQIHAGTMSEAEAMDLMVTGGFQEEAEARKKWDRARLTSTQLSTYFVGSMEMWDLERERRRSLAAAAGGSQAAAAIPQPALVGGFGETPGFVYRDHLEAVLSHGMPPIPFLRRILLDGDRGS